MTRPSSDQRIRSIRRQLTAWAVVAGVFFAGFGFAAAAAFSNGTSGGGALAIGAALSLAVFIYLQVLRQRATAR